MPHRAKIFQKKLCDRSRDIRLNSFGPNWYQIVLLIEKGQNWTQITHLSLKRTFMKNWLMLTLSTSGIYPHHNTAMFKKIINADHKIQGCLRPNCNVFPTKARNKEESSTRQKFVNSLFHHQEKPPPPISYPHVLIQYTLHFWLFSCCHCCFTIFILTFYSLYTQVMLILILISV